MEEIIISPQNVCSRKMIIHVENSIVQHVEIIGGCDGNTHAISNLLIGMNIEHVVEKLRNIRCRGSRNGNTSCPNELAKGLEEYLNK